MAWTDRHKQATGAAFKGSRPAFHFTASPWDLFVREDGEVLPILGIITHEKGLDGCRSTGPGADDVDEGGALLNARASGRRVIEPDEMEVLAWGVVRRGYIGDEKMEPLKAAGGNFWLDAWTRMEWIHDEPQFVVDPDGYLDFHRRVLALICPQGLIAGQIAIAERRSVRKAGPGGKPFPPEPEQEPAPEQPQPRTPTRKS